MVTTNSGIRSHPRIYNHRISYRGTPPTPTVLRTDPHQPSTTYRNHPIHNHYQRHIRSDKKTVVVFNKYHLWKKIANIVMAFWEWIKFILKIKKLLAKITKTRPKRKTKQNIRHDSCKRYFIRFKRVRHSRVVTKRSRINNHQP